MTTVDAVYPYATHPSEATLVAIGNLREVYGIRRVHFDQAASTVRVEYDATRLNEATVHQLLRRSGLDIGNHETLASHAPPPVPTAQ
jgi:copper chaperone CopZ